MSQQAKIHRLFITQGGVMSEHSPGMKGRRVTMEEYNQAVNDPRFKVEHVTTVFFKPKAH